MVSIGRSLLRAYDAWAAERDAYGTGAATASFVFFFALGYGASLLAPQMQRPNAWRVLDTIIAVVMFALAIGMARASGWLGA